ncbi:MAG: PKD domain-containing protein, partial [Bacteroidia bacterium]
STTANTGSTYSWTISGGSILTATDSNAVVVEWLHNGTGSISVKETNSLGCDTTVEVNNIVINERPVPVILGDTVVCRNTEGYIYATTANTGAKYSWTITGGTAQSRTDSSAIMIKWLKNGTGSVSVKETNSLGCDTTVLLKVIINERPVPVISGDTAVCRNTDGHVYSTKAISGNTYIWAVTGGTILTKNDSNAVVVEWGNDGTGSITVKQANALACDTSVMQNVTINPRPTPSLTGDTIACRNTEGHFYSTKAVSGNKYTWVVDGGEILNGDGTNAIEVKWLHNGTGTVELTEENSFGCDTTVKVTNVRINPRPAPKLAGDTTVCKNSNGHMYQTDSVSGNSYEWFVTGGTIDSGQATNRIWVTWLGTGSGKVAVKETNILGCDTTVEVSNIKINPRPAPVLKGDTTVCRNTKSNIYSTPLVTGNKYVWTVTGGVIESGQNTNQVSVNWLHSDTGSIAVTETNSFGCDSTAEAKNVFINPRPAPVLTGDTSVCRNTTGHVYSTPGISGHTYIWSVNGGTITSGQNTNSIVVTWLHNGMGTVSVKETNIFGCDTTVSVNNILIKVRPVPVISGDADACRSSNHTYSTASNSGSIYKWNVFGGKITSDSTKNIVMVTWTNNSAGSISVTETNAQGCDTTVSMNIGIRITPVQTLTGDFDVCENEFGFIYRTQYDADYTYNWTVAGGKIMTSSTSNTIRVNWGKADSGFVQVRVTNSIGCDTLMIVPVNIKPKPKPAIGGPRSVCAFGDTATYTAAGVINAGDKFKWIVSGGKILTSDTLKTIRVKWLKDGKGVLVLKQINKLGCDTTIIDTVIINPAPVAKISGNTDVCAFTRYHLYKTVANADYNYTWTVTNGNVVTGANTNEVVIEWFGSGKGKVVLKVQNFITGCITKDSVEVNIKDAPTPKISGPDFHCEKFFKGFYTTLKTNGNTYEWSVKGGKVLSGQGSNTVEIIWEVPGMGEVTVKETSPTGCDSTVTYLVKVGLLNLSIVTPTQIGCAPAKIDFGVAGDEGVTHYEWSFGDGTRIGGKDKNQVSHLYFAAGSYQVRLIVYTDKGCTDTAVSTINIYSKPKADFDYTHTINSEKITIEEDTVIFKNKSVGGYTYFWDFGDGNTDTTANPQHVYSKIGLFEVKLVTTNANGCKDSIIKQIYVTAVIRLFAPNAITPDGDGINDGYHVVTHNITEFEILIFNRWGEIIYRSNDKNFIWDGKFKGQTVQQDVYPYIIRAKGVTGETVNKKGHIYVIW